MRTPPPLRIALGSSSLARRFVLALAFATAGVAWTLPLPPGAWLAACALLVVWAVRRCREFGDGRRAGDTTGITLAHDRRLVVHDAAAVLPGRVRDLTYVSALVTAIVWRPEGCRRSRAILVLPDMLPADDFRRLRVLLRYGRSEEVAGAPASQA